MLNGLRTHTTHVQTNCHFIIPITIHDINYIQERNNFFKVIANIFTDVTLAVDDERFYTTTAN